MFHECDATPSAISAGAAKSNKTRSALLRPAIDAGLAFVLFLVATMTFASAPTAASPYLAHDKMTAPFAAQPQAAIAEAGEAALIEIATTESANSPDAVYRRTSSSAAWVLLSFAFSVIAALNLALVRHMRQAYANPRSPRQS